MDDAIWCASQMFARGLVTGSTGNISFLKDGEVFISRSGGCLGRLDESSFAKLSLSGAVMEAKPSKEYPLHLACYHVSEKNRAVIHTHSFYITLLSCLKEKTAVLEELYSYTPYLKMLTGGNIKSVSYYKPGSAELFQAFETAVEENTKICLLSNHGVVICGTSMMKAFYLMEELERSARILYHIHGYEKEDYRRI